MYRHGVDKECTDLDKQWDTVETADDSAVVGLTSQDVQGTNSALDNLLHSHPIHVRPLLVAIGTDRSPLQIPDKTLHAKTGEAQLTHKSISYMNQYVRIIKLTISLI